MRRVEAVRQPTSYADLQRMPDDGNRYELYDGELCVVPAPLLIHQIVAGRLHALLLDLVRRHGGAVFFAPLDIVFPNTGSSILARAPSSCPGWMKTDTASRR